MATYWKKNVHSDGESGKSLDKGIKKSEKSCLETNKNNKQTVLQTSTAKEKKLKLLQKNTTNVLCGCVCCT